VALLRNGGRVTTSPLRNADRRMPGFIPRLRTPTIQAMAYPNWIFYPTESRPPEWVRELVAVVEAQEPVIASTTNDGLDSNTVLDTLRPGLLALGYEVESGKKQHEKLRRPVLYGPQGSEVVTYEVDGVHDELGIVLEVEAGRAVLSNAIYRDLIRASLIVGVRFLALGVMLEYRSRSGGKVVTTRSFDATRNQLDAIYASRRLQLPFEGVLLFGY
jgi:hypothetical protein